MSTLEIALRRSDPLLLPLAGKVFPFEIPIAENLKLNEDTPRKGGRVLKEGTYLCTPLKLVAEGQTIDLLVLNIDGWLYVGNEKLLKKEGVSNDNEPT